MTWNELLDLSTSLPGAAQHVVRHGIAAALKSQDAHLKWWVDTTHELSPYTICAVLDHHGVGVPAEAVDAVRGAGRS